MSSIFKFFEGQHEETAYEYYGRQDDSNIPDNVIWVEGYNSAERGYPINNYPIYLNEREREIFYRGWNHYINNH